MRFPSSLSSYIPSDLNGEDITFQTSLYDSSSHHSSSSPESTLSDDSKILYPDNFWNLQQRDCMLGSANEWMQPFGYSLPFQPADEFVDSTNDHGDLSQLYGESAYAPAFHPGLPQQFPQQSVGSHRRLQSSSSAASAADSPYSHNASIPAQQYPSTYTQPAGFPTAQASGWAWDSVSPISGAQHLPTPTGTPTSDQYAQAVQGQAQNPRRTRQSTPNLHAARVRAHHILRDSLNQQWKPNTYMQSHLQIQAQNFYVDMPRTPQTVHSDDAEVQQYNAVATTVPKLDRTVSDARADELYNTFGDPSTMAPRPQNQNFLQPQPPALQERLIAANKARSSSPSSPSGHASPFRKSPYGNPTDFNAQGVSQAPTAMPNYGPIEQIPTAASQQPRGRAKQENDEPKTVSPKDAFPEQPVPKQEENYPSLFPEPSQPLQYAPYHAPAQELSSFTSVAPGSWSYQSTSLPSSTQFDVKQEGVSQEQQYGPVYASATSSANTGYLPPNLTSMETTRSDDSDQLESMSDSGAERPSDTSANTARYTCPFKYPSGTYCGECFDDAAQLNRHKKEHNRTMGNHKDDKSFPKMSQAGPHTCKFINPKTGEPCNSSFSRPYDLTRHEETLHGNRKKVQCPLCTEEKSFSRTDALTRHLRVVHESSAGTSKPRGRGRG